MVKTSKAAARGAARRVSCLRGRRSVLLAAACAAASLAPWARAAEAQPASAQPAVVSPADPAGPAATQPGTEATANDGPLYKVSGFELQYVYPDSRLPSLKDLENTTITLGKAADGYVSPRQGVPQVKAKLADLGRQEGQEFHASALMAAELQLVDELSTRRKLLGIYVSTDPKDIEIDAEGRPGQDLRQGRTTLRLLITTSKVKAIRSIASGEGAPTGGRENLPEHARIREKSPLKPEDVLTRDALDDFVLRLNRHPGRRVDVAVAASDTPGEVMLDYLVTESKPWFVYAQVSNTGTKETNDWRERFGFVNNQLTHHDDILSVDYTTASFDGSSQAVNAAYEAPLLGLDRLRWRAYGTWSDFVASDVGQALAQFNGSEWIGGGEFIANIFQHKSFFVDAFTGMRFESISVTNRALEAGQTDQTGDGDFYVPYIGLRAEQIRETSALNGEARFSYGTGDVNRYNLDRLGRLGTTDEWQTLSADGTYSFFLEPLFAPKAFEEGKGTLAHEIFLAMRGQYAFHHRLVPQEEMTMGGFFSVRGYPESVLASDSAVVGTAEYRFHIPRGLKPRPKALQTPLGEFRYAPARPYARPDWDLILRAFVDAGRTMYSDTRAPESNEAMLGTGVGVELQIKQNFSVRLDWGFALEKLESANVQAGDSRLHFMAMFLF